MSRRILQVVTGILALVPIMTGIVAMTGINDPLYVSLEVPRLSLLDSNLRFFAGLWLGLGIAMLWLIPTIERQATLSRTLGGRISRWDWQASIDCVYRSSARSFYWLHGARDYWSAAVYLLAGPDRAIPLYVDMIAASPRKLVPALSAAGHGRSSRFRDARSALHTEADEHQRHPDIRNGPKADIVAGL